MKTSHAPTFLLLAMVLSCTQMLECSSESMPDAPPAAGVRLDERSPSVSSFTITTTPGEDCEFKFPERMYSPTPAKLAHILLEYESSEQTEHAYQQLKTLAESGSGEALAWMATLYAAKKIPNPEGWSRDQVVNKLHLDAVCKGFLPKYFPPCCQYTYQTYKLFLRTLCRMRALFLLKLLLVAENPSSIHLEDSLSFLILWRVALTEWLAEAPLPPAAEVEREIIDQYHLLDSKNEVESTETTEEELFSILARYYFEVALSNGRQDLAEDGRELAQNSPAAEEEYHRAIRGISQNSSSGECTLL